MRDSYDIKLILNNGFFAVFKEQLDNFARDQITAENYEEFGINRVEVARIQKELKLTKSRVRCDLRHG